MKNVLEEIIAFKRQDVSRKKHLFPQTDLLKAAHFSRTVHSLKRALLTKGSGIIAEFKRQSPSQGAINTVADVALVAKGYYQAGAVAVSVLTDAPFFGGSLDDLMAARNVLPCPILRKDFIVDEYQVLESKYAGADAILLIASALTPDQIISLAGCARQIGLEVVLEVHNAEELRANKDAPVDIIGVNNRNLKTFQVSTETSIRLADLIPESVVRISESGLENAVEVIGLKRLGYNGFLMGRHFMEQPDPVKACSEFIQQIEQMGLNE